MARADSRASHWASSRNVGVAGVDEVVGGGVVEVEWTVAGDDMSRKCYERYSLSAEGYCSRSGPH